MNKEKYHLTNFFSLILGATTAARLVNLPQQMPQHVDSEKLTSSPSRPSILRRREGERDNVMPGKIKIFFKMYIFQIL